MQDLIMISLSHLGYPLNLKTPRIGIPGTTSTAIPVME